jgi:hypothetical protein
MGVGAWGLGLAGSLLVLLRVGGGVAGGVSRVVSHVGWEAEGFVVGWLRVGGGVVVAFRAAVGRRPGSSLRWLRVGGGVLVAFRAAAGSGRFVAGSLRLGGGVLAAFRTSAGWRPGSTLRWRRVGGGVLVAFARRLGGGRVRRWFAPRGRWRARGVSHVGWEAAGFVAALASCWRWRGGGVSRGGWEWPGSSLVRFAWAVACSRRFGRRLAGGRVRRAWACCGVCGAKVPADWHNLDTYSRRHPGRIRTDVRHAGWNG